MQRLSFTINGRAHGSRARAGVLQTDRATVQTPVFMPVGTAGTVKGLRFHEMEAAGSKIMLANTYHLLLRPGPDVFERFGGIQKFINWPGLVLTDSGGFQVFSLADHVRIETGGAVFKSHIDGRKITLTPESCIATQRSIGSDIMMVLDQCVPSTSDHATSKAAMDLTHAWALRCLAARPDESRQAMFGIVQGACYPELRRQSAEAISSMPFDGIAIGGLAVGETLSERQDMTEVVTGYLPEDKPRYLMGVGTPIDLLEAVHRGVDMFDCILPTALSGQGVAYTSRGPIRLTRSAYRYLDEPVDKNCSCYTCSRHSMAYIHHLSKSREQLGWHLLSIHNLTFYHNLMAAMRRHILDQSFLDFYEKQREILAATDEEFPVVHPVRKRPLTAERFEMADFEVVKSTSGYASIRQKSSGEVMHSSLNPDEEAFSLYVDQPSIPTRVDCRYDKKQMIIWDVGLGAGHNAMATIMALEKAYSRMSPGEGQPVHIISFEKEMIPLQLALNNPSDFRHVRHEAPKYLKHHGTWQSKLYPLSWELVAGDFLETMNEQLLPSIIFYDPFSAKVDSELWTWQAFSQLRDILGKEATEIYTYSASTAVRAAMLAAGFFVAAGRQTGSKNQTTIALTPAALDGSTHLKKQLLRQDWLDRWHRSSARYSMDVSDDNRHIFEATILGHKQFTLEP